MREVDRPKRRVLLGKEPADAVLHRIRDRLELLARGDHWVAECDRAAVEEAAEKSALVHDVVEAGQMQDLLARLAVERQPDQRLADLHDGAGRQVVQAVEIDLDRLPEIAWLQSPF